MASTSICSIPNCGKFVHGFGVCLKHYKRLRKHGDPLKTARRPPGTIVSYINDVALTHEGDGCLIWPFHRMRDGRAVATLSGRTRMMARFICEKVNGPPPEQSYQAAHSCGKGNDGCVNPRHLSWKTRSENEMDKFEHGTRVRGSAHSWSKLTEDDVIKIRQMAGALSQGRIAKMFGLRQSTVSQIISRQRWSHLP